MEYVHTRHCLEDVMRSFGYLDVDQVDQFFRNAPDARNLNLYVNRYVAYHIFDYDEKMNRIKFHSYPELKPDIIRRRVKAFWIVASFGYDNVREIAPLRYPSQLTMISEDNECYDITVCQTVMEANMAVRARKLLEVPGANDFVNHIAIVDDHELGRKILPLGFDSYCILDGDHNPQYFSE